MSDYISGIKSLSLDADGPKLVEHQLSCGSSIKVFDPDGIAIAKYVFDGVGMIEVKDE